MTLTFELAIWCLCTAHTASCCCTFVFKYIKFLQLMKELWTRQAVLGKFITLCGLDLLSYRPVSQARHIVSMWLHLCQVISNPQKWQSYGPDKFFLSHLTLTLDIAKGSLQFQQLMKELWTGQAVVSHLNLNYNLDLSHKVLTQRTLSHEG